MKLRRELPVAEYDEIRGMPKPVGRGGYLATWETEKVILEDFAKECGGVEMLVAKVCGHVSDGGSAVEMCRHYGLSYGVLMAFMRGDVQYSRRYDQAVQDRRGRDAEVSRGMWDEVMGLEARDLPSWTEKLSASEKMARSSGLLRDGGVVEREVVLTEAQIREQLAELLGRNPDVRRALVEQGVDVSDAVMVDSDGAGGQTARHESASEKREARSDAAGDEEDSRRGGREDGVADGGVSGDEAAATSGASEEKVSSPVMPVRRVYTDYV